MDTKRLFALAPWIISGIASLFLLVLIGDLLFAGWLYSWFAANLQNIGFLPGPLVTICAVWFMVITLSQFQKVMKAFLRHDVRGWSIRAAIVITAWSAFVFLLVHPPDDWYFNPFHGSPLFQYARRADGAIVLYPIGYGYKYDPRINAKLEPLTAPIALEYEAQKKRRRSPGDRAGGYDHPTPEAFSQGMPASRPPLRIVSVMKKKDVLFDVRLRACRRFPTVVECSFDITNYGAAAVFSVLPEESMAVDDQGIVCRASRAMIGGITSTRRSQFFGLRETLGPPEVEILSGTTVSGNTYLEGASPKANDFQAVRITIRHSERKSPDRTQFDLVSIRKAP